MKRLVLFFSLSLVAATVFVNCSATSSMDGDSGNTTLSSETDDTAFRSVKVLNVDTEMKCYEDHIQVGGSCNTGDAKDNYIAYWLTRDRVTMTWGTTNPTKLLTTAKCENGRFYAIVPKPNDPDGLATTGAGDVEYQLHMQLYVPQTTSGGATFYQAGETSPIFTFQIQKNANCGG